MTRRDIETIFERVHSWPEEPQAELARIALAIEARERAVEPTGNAIASALARCPHEFDFAREPFDGELRALSL